MMNVKALQIRSALSRRLGRQAAIGNLRRRVEEGEDTSTYGSVSA
jgi:hypothetical protein